MLVGLNTGGFASSDCIAAFQGTEPRCDGGGVLVAQASPFRLPTTSAAASAETPADMWTTKPPAKSMDPKPLSQPSGVHTQCAMGM
jgi:hypothetical protein